MPLGKRTLFAAVVAVGLLTTVRAQTITVTIKGNVEALSGMLQPFDPPTLLDSSVQIGTPFTFVQAIDATAQPDPVFGDYVSGPGFVSSLTVGDYDFVASGSKTYLGDYVVDFFPNAELDQYGLSNPVFSARLFNGPGASGPLTLSSLVNDSLYNFEGGDVQLDDFTMGGILFLGDITSFQAIEIPEPSIFVLFVSGACGAVTLGCFRRRGGAKEVSAMRLDA